MRTCALPITKAYRESESRPDRRAIGVSNFDGVQLDSLREAVAAQPAHAAANISINQVAAA